MKGPENFESKNILSDVEKSANFEGNETLLFYDRLHNPEIREQIIDLMCEYEATKKPAIITNYEMDDKDNFIEVSSVEEKRRIKTREELEEELEERIKVVFSSTDVDYKETVAGSVGGIGHVGTIFLHSINPENNQRYTGKQLSITEAHEKGHGVRNFNGSGDEFKLKILSGFDFSQIGIGEKMRNAWKMANKKEGDDEGELGDDIINQEIVHYFTQPNEIIERMAQLRNYFGMKGTEIFTKEHLEYVRRNYTKDTGFVVEIQLFLDAITPETEEKFLKLINTLGV